MGNTSKVHVPLGFSPHVCVVMNGHLTNPSCRSSSLGLRLRTMDLEVNDMWYFVDILTLLIFVPCSHRRSHEHDDVTTSRWIESNNGLDMFQIIHLCLRSLARICFQLENQRSPGWDFASVHKIAKRISTLFLSRKKCRRSKKFGWKSYIRLFTEACSWMLLRSGIVLEQFSILWKVQPSPPHPARQTQRDG